MTRNQLCFALQPRAGPCPGPALQPGLALTWSSSSGRSPPSLMPRFMAMNRSAVGLSFTLGLCRLVFNMMMAKDST